MNNPPGNNPAGMPDRAGQPDSEKVITEMYSLEFIGNLLGNADCLIVCENKLSRIGELDYTAPTAGNTHNNGMSHKRKLDQRIWET